MPLSQSHKVLVEWGAEFDNFDPVTQVWLGFGFGMPRRQHGLLVGTSVGC